MCQSHLLTEILENMNRRCQAESQLADGLYVC